MFPMNRSNFEWLKLGKERTVAENNDVEMMLLEVRPSNISAINLYSNLGFNEIARRKDYYPAKKGREDAIVFARHLFN